MSKLSATAATSAFSQLGSSDTFCAVISRFVSERCADVSVSSRWFLLEHSFSHDFLKPACLGFVVTRPVTESRKFFQTSRCPCAQAVSELASSSSRGPSRGVGTRFRPPRDSCHHQFFRIPIQLITLCVRRCFVVVVVVRFG